MVILDPGCCPGSVTVGLTSRIPNGEVNGPDTVRIPSRKASSLLLIAAHRGFAITRQTVGTQSESVLLITLGNNSDVMAGDKPPSLADIPRRRS